MVDFYAVEQFIKHSKIVQMHKVCNIGMFHELLRNLLFPIYQHTCFDYHKTSIRWKKYFDFKGAVFKFCLAWIVKLG